MEEKISNKEIIKKVIQIKKGEYLLEIRNNAVATTYNLDHALDVTNWSLKQLGYIVGNLEKVGYSKVKVSSVSKEDLELYFKTRNKEIGVDVRK